MAHSKNHLLVFGASGVSGWACVKEALSFPTPATFQRITGLTNRPLSIEDAKLPKDDRLELISGIDLTTSASNVASLMREKIKDVKTITHVIYTAYIEKSDFDNLREINMQILKTAVEALDQVAPDLQSVVLQTGGKAYGVEFADKLEIRPPLKESQARIPQPYYDKIFYYPQHDHLATLSPTRPWTFTETRPDVIIGFTPGTNYMNIAQGLGLWLSLAREVLGPGARVPFPGTPKSYRNKHTDTSQDILARMNLFAAVNSDQCGGGAVFNVADGNVVTWAEKWEGPNSIPSHFGLVGTPPGDEPYSVEDFIKTHADTWQKLVSNDGLREGIMENFSWGFVYGVMTLFDFDREYDLGKAREVGFNEKIETVEGFKVAFERMREARIIP